ncbi:hypothetical protein [Bradyrhizobium sp. CER78]|uniref:hypothetical protein n=1 Tax=Bradyrhizobium sp. CER78 TaxID=3039162 RepID=UPI0024486072|nr:hypothetical protein [Bradyrhizobium sp. CER78]MDH2383260.1 hypothetical protein [Bradyrhizobium sp. CER78]
MLRLSDAFPGIRFHYEAEEPPAAVAARAQMSILLRIWLFFFGRDTSYPRRQGYFENGKGGSVEFYFEARQPVPSITATSYGMTAGLDENFGRLYAATGWKIVYPRF